jgi:calcineurin-like phosphoesterase family protein
MKKTVLTTLFLLSLMPVLAQRMVEGNVYIDTNLNGIHDHGEASLSNTPMSNGRDIVVTDVKGHYKIMQLPGASLFPILPADYTLPTSKVVNAGFIASEKILKKGNDFGLEPKTVKEQFRLNAIGDVQVSNYEELEYATQTLWPELLEGKKEDLTLWLGDLVNNNLALYPDIRQLMEQLPSQSFTVPGNHDRDADSIRRNQSRSYNATFGSDVYAFNEGKVHFILLNNVYGDGTRGYHGEITEEQMAFVKNDLALVPDDRLIVLSMHIPLATTKNRNALLDILKGRKEVLAITGHLHRVMRFFYGKPDIQVHEVGAGATCGFWWVGEKGWDGIPSALQQGGTPRNYFIFNFDGTHYTFHCKAVGLDANRQMTIHITGIDTLDTHLRDMKNIGPHQAMITVWGGCDSTEVRCRIDGGEWLTCKQAKEVDINAARTREMNLQKQYPTRYNRMNPIRKQESPQLWMIALPAEASNGAHQIEVEATDKYGFKATGRRSFCFPKEASLKPQTETDLE